MLQKGDRAQLAAILSKARPIEVAQVLVALDEPERDQASAILFDGSAEFATSVLAEMSPDDRIEQLEKLDPAQILRSAYIDPSPLFASLQNYTGRDWLVAEIDSFLRDNDRGYFIIEGEPGVGKTAFLAQLVKQRGYINHFAREGFDTGNARIGFRNLIAQLYRAWRLENTPADSALMYRDIDQEIWQEFLYKASRRRDETKPDEKIIR
jgi:hypothetical protein